MKSNEKEYVRKAARKQSANMIETIYGCKWALTVYQMLADRVNRPGEMVRYVKD